MDGKRRTPASPALKKPAGPPGTFQTVRWVPSAGGKPEGYTPAWRSRFGKLDAAQALRREGKACSVVAGAARPGILQQATQRFHLRDDFGQTPAFVRPGAAAIWREQGRRLIAVRYGIRCREEADVLAEARTKLAPLFQAPYRAEWSVAGR